MKDALIVVISEPTHVAEARRAATEICRRLALSDATIARSELSVVELAGNILQHAERGTLYLGPTASLDGLQIIASDLGPGVGDLDRAMADGFSTRTTPGLGLGTVRRKADVLDIYSRRNEGTIASAILRDRPAPAETVAVLSTYIEGESVNGDSWATYNLPGRTLYLMVDGLGHGHHANEAASMALRICETALEQDPQIALSAIMRRMDLPMRATRGAAIMLIAVAAGSLLCCGVGNISAVLCAEDGTTRSLVSHNGTVGHRMARVQEFAYPITPGQLLIAHSDGISTRWKLSQYPGAFTHAPATIAGLIYRDAVRGRDDATVLVSRLADSRLPAPPSAAHLPSKERD